MVLGYRGDTHQLYVSADVDTEFRPDLKEIEETIERNKRSILDYLSEKSTKTERETGLYAPAGWFEVSNEDMMEIYNSIVSLNQHTIAQKEEKREEKETERNAIMEKAVQTGKKQVLSKTHDECNDPEESCDIDEIVEYAKPDGTTETVRYHTW